MKRVPINRADLLTVLADSGLSSDTNDEPLAATLLGFVADKKKSKPKNTEGETYDQVSKVSSTKTASTSVATELQASRTNQLSFAYWQLVKQKNRDEEKQQQKKQRHVKKEHAAIWQNRPKTVPDYPALTSIEDLRSRLFPLLTQQSKGRLVIDLPELLNKVSRAEWLGELPKTVQSSSVQALHIIDDRQIYLTPYWFDHAWIIQHLYTLLACYQISRAVIESGDVTPQLIVESLDWLDYVLPPPQTPVLLLSDLGRLSAGAGHYVAQLNPRQRAYQHLLQQFTQNQNPVIVLTPCQPVDYPAVVHQHAQIVAWESKGLSLHVLQGRDSTVEGDETLEKQWLGLLFVLLSPAIRLEPALLRHLRQQLKHHDRVMPAAMEALLWRHTAIKDAQSIAATIDPWRNKENRKKWAAQPIALQRLALRTLKQWRATPMLPDEIWFEELLSIESLLSLETLFQDDELKNYQHDIDAACCFLTQIAAQKKWQGDQKEAYRSWLARLETRISEAAVQQGSASHVLQTVIQQLHPNKTISASGHVIDPALRPLVASLPKQSAWLCQRGNQWMVTAHDPFHIPQRGSSVIAAIEYRQPYIQVQYATGKSQQIALPERIDQTFVVLDVDKTVLSATEFVLKTDQTECHLKSISKPEWAERIGRDAYGLFTDVILAEDKQGRAIEQRFRWIPAGSFMMGSPESEAERHYDEDYHQVTHTTGYWLADTTVTQRLWQAVMGDNPAHFKGENRPVEKVSWDDIQDFLNKTDYKIADLPLRLPTEAEWEYACRATTTTPFSFGDNITAEQVNFNGSRPYANGKKSEDRGKTVAVKSLPANQWGLYEMHGNVYEWCADEWQTLLGKQPVVNPCQYSDGGSNRVVRGGSWIDVGRDVRSAYRNHYSPAYRSYNDRFGFRLFLGRELPSRERR